MLFRSPAPRLVSLALQGGGAHGAFTWGVLDRLLENERLVFDGVSGASAGAMNAVVLAHGLLQGGRAGAREALGNFWRAVASSAPIDLSLGADTDNGRMSASAKMMLYWLRPFSPEQFNPFDINPLRDIVSKQIDFERLRAQSKVRLFVAATNANTGKLRLFQTGEMTAAALLASACLPSVHRAIEIDGEPYWDGAYSANPAVFPLFYDCTANDILFVLLSPPVHGRKPRSAEEIRGRALELSFNSTFLREMRTVARARAYAARSILPLGRLERRLKRANFHLIEAADFMSTLAAETKMTTSLSFLEKLRDKGRARASDWLAAHERDVGRRSSIDIVEMFS